MNSNESVEPAETEEERHWSAVLCAARQFIQLRNDDVVSIHEVLEHLDDCFGADASLTNDVSGVLLLCVELWEDPHIDQVPGPWIWFAWNEEP